MTSWLRDRPAYPECLSIVIKFAAVYPNLHFVNAAIEPIPSACVTNFLTLQLIPAKLVAILN